LLQRKYKQSSDRAELINITRESLASIAGTATESLIRTLTEFKSEQLIYINNGRISILNQKKLEELVN
jgi:CRP/FNR family cyclic AMP-dependent transcriptional regulator